MTLHLLKHFLRLRPNVWKTLYLNFKVFQLKDAIRLPVLCFGKIRLEGLRRGCIKLVDPKMGGVKIGGGWHTEMFGYAQLYKSLLRIEGVLELGSDVTISQGCVISVSKGAILRIGNNFKTNVNVRIHAKQRIEIEDNCRMGWDCQVFDTSFHYTISKGTLSYRHQPVYLGHNTWLSNGVTVMKGTQLPAYSVVAAKSLVNKDYTQYGEKSLFAGTPAKFKYSGIQRILGHESEIDNLFVEGIDQIAENDIKNILKNQ